MSSATTTTATVVCTSSHTPQVNNFTLLSWQYSTMWWRAGVIYKKFGCCSTKPVHTVVNDQLPLNSLSALLGSKPTLFLSGFSVENVNVNSQI